MRIDTGYVISSITVQILLNTKMQATDYKKILFNYDFKVEAILDIANMYLLEKMKYQNGTGCQWMKEIKKSKIYPNKL